MPTTAAAEYPRLMACGGDSVLHAPGRASCPTPVLLTPVHRGRAGLRAREMQGPGHQHDCGMVCGVVSVTASCLPVFPVQLVVMLNTS